MKKLVILAIFVLTVFSLSFVKAQDEPQMSLGATFDGQTGLILVPTAESLNEGQLRIALKGYTIMDKKNVSSTNDRLTIRNYTITASYGATTNLEIGAGTNTLATDYEDKTNTANNYSDNETATIVNVKYNVYPEASKSALFAVAATRQEYKYSISSTQTGKSIWTSVYGIASKLLDEVGNFKGTIGVGWQQSEDKTPTTSTKETGAYYFGGFEYKIMPTLGLSVEYSKSLDDADATTNDRWIAYGVRYGFTPSFNLEVGAVDTGSGSSEVFVGLGYTFGGKAK